MTFVDRADAGRQLALLLSDLDQRDVVVLGLPRGGVVVAAEVARALGAPLDVIVVRKLGVPIQPELAMGALGEDGVRIVVDEVIRRAGVTLEQLARVERQARSELDRQAQLFRRDRPRLSLIGRTALLVDDGIATGSSAVAACQVSRAHGAARVVLAVPVGSPDAVTTLSAVADEVRCLYTPSWLGAIGQFYGNFAQTSDQQVVELLRQLGSSPPSSSAAPSPSSPDSSGRS